jgi:hypothetical protein
MTALLCFFLILSVSVHLAGRRCGGDVANGTPAAAEEWHGPAVLSA